MDGFGFSGENNLIPSSDFLDNVVKFLDFPLENVEEESVVGDCGVGFEGGLDALCFDTLLGLSSNICSEGRNAISEVPKIQSVSYNETSQLLQPANFFRGVPNGSIPLQNAPSNNNTDMTRTLKTLSPEYILEHEETKPLSFNFVHLHREIQCVPTSDKSQPSDYLGSLPKVTHPTTELDPSKGILNSQGRTLLKKRKRKNLSVLSGTIELNKNSLPRPTNKAKVKLIASQKPIASKKCSHCETTKTPQWRKGPLGPMTLCNACGVRNRSGHLVPEYRPAASPTFVKSLHSNSLRKVMELRDKGNGRADLDQAEDVANAMSPPPGFKSKKSPSQNKPAVSKKCSHCETTKTPRCSKGPMMLCDECGIWYRSRRLGPTFVESLNSNSHSKAIKLRGKTKEDGDAMMSHPIEFVPMEAKKNHSQKPAVSRKCSHCETMRTPQWREGPMGPMTLCNACGVRYRSGRLVPEYRPAASPTFVESLHSNRLMRWAI